MKTYKAAELEVIRFLDEEILTETPETSQGIEDGEGGGSSQGNLD